MTNSMPHKDKPQTSILRWLRNRFFTGVVIALPIVATIWGVTWFVQIIDENVLRFLPVDWNPKTYLGFDIPGLRLFARVPIVSPVYGALKQIVTTVADQKDRAFRDVCLLEYPRPGLWAIGFVTADLSGAPEQYLKEGYVCVFVPTTPNPTSGFLLFSKSTDIQILDMTPEEGAKMIISGGMVSSNEDLIDLKKPKPSTR